MLARGVEEVHLKTIIQKRTGHHQWTKRCLIAEG
jgi:hypothetical protein